MLSQRVSTRMWMCGNCSTAYPNIDVSLSESDSDSDSDSPLSGDEKCKVGTNVCVYV